MPDIKRISTHKARTELEELIKKVAEAGGATKLKKPENASDSAKQWLTKLETAQSSLEEWCEPGGDEPFSIDVLPQ